MDVVAKEAVATNKHDETLLAVTKRKRTKRQRLLLPLSAPSPTSTSTVSGCTTEEEEDMANCLILLAQGHTTIPRPSQETELHIGNIKEKFTSRRFAEASTTTPGKAGFYVYECKTCNKCFPSFQALGGHRASHKKPKLAPPPINEDGLELSMSSLSKIRVVGKVRTHECSICGSEFSSGQALGGHMRRHRPAGAAEAPEARKERSVLSLDLNLPAPSEEERGGELLLGFPFMFSTSGMVDCHY